MATNPTFKQQWHIITLLDRKQAEAVMKGLGLWWPTHDLEMLNTPEGFQITLLAVGQSQTHNETLLAMNAYARGVFDVLAHRIP